MRRAPRSIAASSSARSKAVHAADQRQERERQHPVDMRDQHRRPEREADAEIAKEHQQHDAADDARHDDRQQHQSEDDALQRKVAPERKRQPSASAVAIAPAETDADAVEQRTEELRRVQHLHVPVDREAAERKADDPGALNDRNTIITIGP